MYSSTTEFMAMSIFNLHYAQALMNYQTLANRKLQNYGFSASKELVSLIFGGNSLFNN